MSLKSYYERQAATSRRLAEQAITHAMAQRLLSAANDYEQRARTCEIEVLPFAAEISLVPDQAKGGA
jgi:hypothetical protein